MGTYNVSKIEGWLKDFTSAKDKFTNTYYNDYKNSYIRSCNDSAVITMRNKLNQHYDRINRINKRIKDVWDDFLYDLKAIDNRLAGGKGSTNDSAVASKLSKLPTLKEYKATLKTRINSASAVVGTVDAVGWAEDKDWGSNLQSVLDRTEATITVAGTSVIEGIGKFGEGIMDACAPIVTEAYCQYHLANTEGFTEETANEARQNSRDFVAKEHVKSWFDEAYENSPELKASKEKAYGFDTIRSVGNEIGEVVPAAVISMIPGVGQVLGPAVYGVAKAGNHIEENFQDENNGYLESILKGYAEGVFDGLFFAAGMKGDAVMKSAAKEVVKEGGKATLKKGGILFAKTIYECGCSVAQDGSNILIDSIFLDGPVQASDGSVIQNPSFLDKLNYCFEQSGGMKGMATSMITATVLSSVSDAVDLRGIKNVDTNTALKNVDINTSSTRKSMSNVNSKNIDITSKSNRSISGASKNATDINSNNVKKSVSDIKNKDINIKSKNKGNTFVGDKMGGSASDPDVLKKIDELRNSKVNSMNNSNGFRIIQDEVGGAAADPNVATIADNISKMDVNAGNVKNTKSSIPNNFTSSQKTDMWLEYNKLVDKVTGSGDFDNKLRLHSRGNFFEGSDEFAKDIEKIMLFEKQLGVPQSSSIIPDIARPFEWSNDKLDIDESLNAERKPIYNYGGMASENQFLANQINPHENINVRNVNNSGNSDMIIDKTIKKGNEFWISSKSISMKDFDDINKKSLFRKTTVYINDDMDPRVIFQNTKKPKNVLVVKDGIQYSYNGKGIRIKPVDNVSNNVSNLNVTDDVLNNSNFVKTLKESTSSTEISLKKKIISSVKPEYDETQLMRKIYIELNKKTNYDVDFVLGDKNTQNSILNKITTFDNLTNGNVVCKGWSELYAEALVDAGIDPSRVKVVKAQNAKHWWVEIDMGDNIIRADATDAFLGSTDLANCKFGDPTNGFLILNKKDAGLRINNEILSNNPNLLKNSNDYFREVDKSIDYINNNGYFTENVSKLKQTFENSDSPYNDLIKENDILKGNVSSYMNMDIPENMNGYDAFAYYRKFSSTLFGSKNSNALPSLKKININGKDYSATVVELFDGSNEFYLTFDEINGKKIYTREEYINGPMNNYKSFN